jgi:phenylalanyl-tRNA synthetase beta chain
MKISYNWLREWVATRLDARALAERLTMAGLEVSALAPAAPKLDNIVVGQVVSTRPHPTAANLTCCEVAVGRARPLAVVCGDAAARPGLKAPLAPAGAILANGTVIQKTEIRGQTSAGMLCSAADLGLAETSEGIMELGADAKPGTPLKDYLDLDDTILELDLTPNRGDCLSVAGLAREISALTGAKLRPHRIRKMPARSRRRGRVILTASRDCPHYAGRVVEGIDPEATTPAWMKERLRRAGSRSIHPVVDVTNYVMHEWGQPMHAFDLDKLAGAIRVRHAKTGESLTLLDGNTVRLESGALLIADDSGPVALAGVMGGRDSAVERTTRHIFLESAFFRPEAVSLRARALGLQTESSQRFERGVDPRLQRPALERATELLLEIAGGRAGPVIERSAAGFPPRTRPILLRRRRIARILGTELPVPAMTNILARLGMRVARRPAGWQIVPPPYRFDVTREIDLIEEIARVHGYEKLPRSRPRTETIARPMPGEHLDESRLRTLLVDRDYQEVITYSFVDPKVQELIDPARKPALLVNPISTDMAVMRTSLWPGLLQTLLYNLNRQQTRVRVFEIGRCFVPEPGALNQEISLAGAATGTALPEQWGTAARAVDYFDVKADVEALHDLTGRSGQFRFQPVNHPALHTGQSAEILCAGKGVGYLGRLHPEIQARLSLDQPVVLFELKISSIIKGNPPVFHEISRFPSIRRDLAVVVEARTPAQTVLDCVSKVAGNLLVNLQLFDEYRGKGIDSGRKSLALGLTLQNSSRTLKEAEVEALMTRVVSALRAEFGAQLRGDETLHGL